MPLFQLALFVSLAVPAAPDPPMARTLPADLAPDEQMLKAANLPVTEQGLLNFFRKRTPSAANDAAVAPLVKQLAEKDPVRYNYAAGELIARGSTAIKQLRILANQVQDPDAAARAHQCLELIEGTGGANLVSTVARLLAAHKPEAAAAVLLDYYPYAEDESVTHDLDQALAAVAMREGKPVPALLRALEDESPMRRAAAAVALCEAGGIGVHERVRPLLKDPKPTVRFQVAMALAKAHDAEAVPILIELLADQPSAQRQQAEEFLADLAGEWAVKVPQGNDATSRRLRRELWLAWWKSLDGKPLLDEFTARTLSDEEFGKVQSLLKKLDGNSAEEREQATQELVGMGPKAVPLLRQCVQQSESRTGTFAQKCVDLIEKGMPNPLPPPAARLLALRRPPGTLEAFLAYLPCAENQASAAEITELIGAVGVREGKPDPLLLKALHDKIPARRIAAALALCFSGSAEQLPMVRKLLQDPEPEVRLQVALALAAVRQRDAVPVLIALLSDVSLTHAYEIEDFLTRLAVEQAPPKESLTVDDASRTKCRDGWEAWWKEHGQNVDLAKVEVDSRSLGLTLVVELYDAATRAGRVVELDAAGKIRWKIVGLLNPVDVQRLPGQRVLIAEQNGNRVTERDRTGKIVWQHSGVTQPFVVQRMRDGNTFIAGRNALLIVDRNGKQVFSSSHPNEYFLGATSFRDGQMAYVNNQGQYVRLDAAGKEVKRYAIPFNPNFGLNSAEILPNENVIIAVQAANKLTEYSPEGKTVWEATIAHVGLPTRLSNGRTLVPNTNAQRIAVLDRDGKLVSEMKGLPVRPWYVSRR